MSRHARAHKPRSGAPGWMTAVGRIAFPIFAFRLAGLFCINWELIGGLVWPVQLFGRVLEVPEQGLAVLALVPVWLYNGKEGPHSRAIQYACYAFYPAHLLALLLILLCLQ